MSPCLDFVLFFVDPPLPSFPPVFHTKLEVTIVNRDMTIEVEEHFDEKANRGSMTSVTPSGYRQIIFDFEQQEAHIIISESNNK